MRDFVWVLGNRSKLGDAELGYSMRSVVKHVKGIGNLIVVGEKPKSPPGVPFLQMSATDPYPFAQRNTLHKATLAAFNSLVSDNFILMNDDFFVRRPVNSWDIPTYRLGNLREHLEERCDSPDHYSLALAETITQLNRSNLLTVDYEAHTPMPLHKGAFLAMLKEFNWYSQPPPLWRSCYGNFYRVNTVATLDHKISEPLIMGELKRRLEYAAFFSCGDGAFTDGGDFRDFLDFEFGV